MFDIKKPLQKITNLAGSVQDILISILYVNIRAQTKNLYRKKKTNLVVLGNGPSLTENLMNNLNFILDKDTVCCNEFAQSDYYEIIKPSYYIFLDPAYWRKTEVQSVNDDLSCTFKAINEKTTWPLTILMKNAGRKWNHFMELERLNNNINIIYFYNNNIAAPRFLRHYLYKKNLAMPYLYNVLGVCIFFGLNIGYKKIFLLGADHSWHQDLIVNNDNILYWRNRHFYDQEESDLTPIYVDSYHTQTFKMHEILLAFSTTFQGYFELENYSKYLNSKVYNATKGSAIDAFERYNINER